MCFSAPKAPPAATPAPVVTPEDPAVMAARERERKRQAAARSGSTLLTSGMGATAQPNDGPKTLLGA